MCIRETKTYIDAAGERTYDTLHLCKRAVGSRPCNRIERRNTEPVRLVEVRPSAERNPSDGVLVTEGFNGRQTRYRDVSIRSSNSSSLRRSLTMSERSPVVSLPSSATSSPSIVEVKPVAPSPPPAVSGFPFRTRGQSPTRPMSPLGPPLFPNPPTSPPDPTRRVQPDGTAVYDRPPSLELPRATENERSRRKEKAPASSRTAEVDENSRPIRIERRPGPSVTIEPNSPRQSSPPPRANSSRKATSRREMAGPSRASKAPIIDQPSSSRRSETEDERQARLERARLAETDRRQPFRDQPTYDTSRDQHHREAFAARESPSPERDNIQQNIDAELAQMQRERASAEVRRRHDSETRDVARRFAEDYVVRDAEGRVRYVTERTGSPPPPPPPLSPLSPRLRREVVPSSVALHHYSPRRRSGTWRDHGDEVIAREQARRATEQLSDALGDVAIGEEDVEVEEVDVGTSRRRRRRDGAGGGSSRRDRPAQRFWR